MLWRLPFSPITRSPKLAMPDTHACTCGCAIAEPNYINISYPDLNPRPSQASDSTVQLSNGGHQGTL
nr:putative Biomphalaria glabrata probable cardiolipin synthase (CMP-forming) [Biomphalaria glabrata]